MDIKFGVLDYAVAFLFIIVFSVVIFFKTQNNKDNPLYNYLVPFFIFKLSMGIFFAYVYVYIYGSGDTTAYFEGANALNQLFFKDSSAYFSELLNNPNNLNYKQTIFLYQESSLPPTWIYGEPNSWIICKILNFFSFFCFGSYLGLTIIISSIATLISFRFFLFVNQITNIKPSYVAIALLFVPSTAFWCSGISKDTITILLMFYFIEFSWKTLFIKFKWKYLFWILISILLINSIRTFVLLSLILPMFTAYLFKFRQKENPLLKSLITFFLIIICSGFLLVFLYYFVSSGEFQKMQEAAEITYSDFKENQTYTGTKYDLGISDFTVISIIKAIPLAITTALYRPFIWEANTILMFLNGLESTYTLILSFQIFRRFRLKKRNTASSSKNDSSFVIFSIGFVIILGLIVGLTSGLFGVLSRFKAPILPFFLIFLFNSIKNKKEKSVTSESNNSVE